MTCFRQYLDRVGKICSPVYNQPDVFCLFSSRKTRPIWQAIWKQTSSRAGLDSEVIRKTHFLEHVAWVFAYVLGVTLTTKSGVGKEFYSLIWAQGSHYFLEISTPLGIPAPNRFRIVAGNLSNNTVSSVVAHCSRDLNTLVRVLSESTACSAEL